MMTLTRFSMICPKLCIWLVSGSLYSLPWCPLPFGQKASGDFFTTEKLGNALLFCHLRLRWHPTPVRLPGKSHGWRSLVGFSPWGLKESDMTERLHFHFHALEKEMAAQSSVLAWRIPGTAEPGGLPSVGLHRVGHDWSDLAAGAAPQIQCVQIEFHISLSLLFQNQSDIFISLSPAVLPRSPCLKCGVLFYVALTTSLHTL